MAIALTLNAKERGDVPLAGQLLFCPVTDASFETGSYHRFAEGYFLRRGGMRWFWDQTRPTRPTAPRSPRPRSAPPPTNSPTSPQL
jgi:acetyl esterase/lipase